MSPKYKQRKHFRKVQTRFRVLSGVGFSSQPGVIFFTGRSIFSKVSFTKISCCVLFFILNLKIFKDQTCLLSTLEFTLVESLPKSIEPYVQDCYPSSSFLLPDWTFTVSSLPYIWPKTSRALIPIQEMPRGNLSVCAR